MWHWLRKENSRVSLLKKWLRRWPSWGWRKWRSHSEDWLCTHLGRTLLLPWRCIYHHNAIFHTLLVQNSCTSLIHVRRIFAPAEGKIPTSILNDDDWDINSFPNLHPTRKNKMFQESLTKMNTNTQIDTSLHNLTELDRTWCDMELLKKTLCHLMPFDATWCNLMQLNTIRLNLTQFDKTWNKMIQLDTT